MKCKEPRGLMNPMRLLGIFIVVVAFGLIASASIVSAQEAVLKTIVDNRNCPLIADGRTEYRLDVGLDNTGLSEATDGARWRVTTPEGLIFNVTRVQGTEENRPERDFFIGRGMYYEYVMPRFNQLHARLVDLGQGVYHGEGNLVSYWFTIAPIQENYIAASFNLTVVEIFSPGGSPQPYRIENQNFVVVRKGFPVMSSKCAR